MKAVILMQENVANVCFDRRLENPWLTLAEIAKDVPGLVNCPVKFSKRIPESDNSYICWECNGNEQPKVSRKTFKEAIAFLKPKRPLRTLGELLEKYASASK